jgi:hypothetical protein
MAGDQKAEELKVDAIGLYNEEQGSRTKVVSLPSAISSQP